MRLTLLKKSDIHWSRKFWHILWGILIFTTWQLSSFSQEFWGRFWLVIALLGFAQDSYRLGHANYNTKFVNIFGRFMRQSELNNYTGIPFYTFGVAIGLIFFSEMTASIGILFLVFADPLGSAVGILSKQKTFFPNKTLAGTSAVFICCTLLSFGVFTSYLPTIATEKIIILSLLAGAVGTIAEMTSAFNIDDNLTIPVVTGIGLDLMILPLMQVL